MRNDRAVRITAMSYLRDYPDKEQRMEKQLLNTGEYILLRGKAGGRFTGLLQMVETNPVSRITGQAIVDLYNSVPKSYRKNAVFLMITVTLNEISRSLGMERDLISSRGDGTFTLMDKPIVQCNAMPFIDTMSGDGELMLTILASLAQEESRSVSENCKWRVRKKFEQGIPTGLRMYGYDVRNGSFTILPEEAEVVRRIFRMYLDGMGSERIMRVLSAEGIPAPEGGPWNAGTIMMMLRNEKYAGDLLLQKSYVNNHVEKKQLPNRGELPQYFVAEDHAPIIDRETFDAVQAEIARRSILHTAKAPSAMKRPDMPMGDRIICGICGKKYRRKITRQGTPYAAPVWICATFNYRGKAFCASKQIPEQTLTELIAAALGGSSTADDVDRIEMHPGNRVLFVFRDGHAEEHFWKDRFRRDSWDAEKRKRAAEKTSAQRQRKEPIEQ